MQTSSPPESTSQTHFDQGRVPDGKAVEVESQNQNISSEKTLRHKAKNRNLLYYGRIFLVSFWFLAMCVVCIPVFLFTFRSPANSKRFLSAIAYPGRWILNLKVKTFGVENFPLKGSAVVVGNHQGTLDLFLNAHFIHKNTVALGKKELLFVPLFGLIFYLSGNIFLQRTNHFDAMAKMKVALQRLRETELSVWVFPEGTRSRGKGLGKFKRGAFYLAAEAGVPLVPVVFSDYYNNVDFSRWNSGTVYIQILPPVYPHDISPEQISIDLEKTRDKMVAEFNRLNSL
jgi:1-acyl-sn-glycerol-3-phosphate acyltransferase